MSLPELVMLGRHMPKDLYEQTARASKMLELENARMQRRSQRQSRTNALRRVQSLMAEQQQLQDKLVEIMERLDKGQDAQPARSDPSVFSNEYWLRQFSKTGGAAYRGIQAEDIPRLREFAEIADPQKPAWVNNLKTGSESDKRVGQALEDRYIKNITSSTVSLADVYQCTSSTKQCELSVGMCRLGDKTNGAEVGSCACNILTGKCLNTASVYRTQTGRGSNPMTYYMQSPEFRVTKAKLDMITQRLVETRRVVGYFK